MRMLVIDDKVKRKITKAIEIANRQPYLDQADLGASQ
jgi:hypothetical protein